MWFIGVEVEQGTSAPPPKKNPGSAPATLTDDHFSTCKPTAESLHVHSVPFDMETAAVG